MTGKITVALADDQQLVRAGFAMVLIAAGLLLLKRFNRDILNR